MACASRFCALIAVGCTRCRSVWCSKIKMRMRRPKPFTLRLFAAFLLGVASVLAFAPFGVFPLIGFTLGGLYALLNRAEHDQQSAWAGALIGWAFGFGLFLSGVSWIYVSLSVFGEMPALLAAVATVLF